MPHKDTVIVAAGRHAWRMYKTYSAYLRQPDKPVQAHTEWLGFYAKNEIKPRVARIIGRRNSVQISVETASRLSSSSDRVDRMVGQLVGRLVDAGEFVGNVNQVFLLSGYDDAETLKLAGPIRNVKRDHKGGLVAWTFWQRYTDSDVLQRGPRTTDELEEIDR